MTDNAFTYVRNRSLRELLARARDQAPHHPALPAADQRQGRALSPDDGARVGLRDGLSLSSPPKSGPATLAALLQRAQTPQRIGRPAADQPRSRGVGEQQPRGLASGGDRADHSTVFVLDETGQPTGGRRPGRDLGRAARRAARGPRRERPRDHRHRDRGRSRRGGGRGPGASPSTNPFSPQFQRRQR